MLSRTLARSLTRSLATTARSTSKPLLPLRIGGQFRPLSCQPRLLKEKDVENSTSSTHPPSSEPIIPNSANASPLSQAESTVSEPPKESIPETEQPRRSGGAGGDKGSDGLPKSAYISSTDRKRERLARFMFCGFLAFAIGGTLYMGRDLDEIEKKIHPTIENGWAFGPFFARVKARINDFLDFYNEPPFDKLLPDPMPDYSRPYTLVISLEDLCIHSTWDREHGWRIAKRPGLDYFLAYLFQYYEIVVFTSNHEAMAAPIIQKMDQYPGYIMYPLFRSHTRYKDGKYIKDLNYLNRDLSKVIMLETNPDAWSANPDNVIKMKPWTGDPNDKELIKLIPFLEYIAAMGIADVRPVIVGFGDKNIAEEFARREAIAREEHVKRVREERQKRKGKGADWLLPLLGMPVNKRREDEEEKTFMDLARERGKQAYEETQRHLAEHKEEMLNEQKRQEKEMAELMKTSLSKIFTEGLPKPPGQ
ncbi:mitochondrial inner membrane protein required for protein import [Rhizina undulata]